MGVLVSVAAAAPERLAYFPGKPAIIARVGKTKQPNAEGAEVTRKTQKKPLKGLPSAVSA
jgi:hypothetical protein